MLAALVHPSHSFPRSPPTLTHALSLPLPPPPCSSPSHEKMDAFFPPESAEYLAHAHIREHIFHDPQIGPQLMGLTAAYAALMRYLTAEHLYILPANGAQLRATLMSYARDVIHSLISQAKTRIPEGGYTQARQIAYASLRDRVLASNEHVALLLSMHREGSDGGTSTPMSVSSDDGELERRRRSAEGFGAPLRLAMSADY